MQKLNIVSMDFTGPRKFYCARKRAYQEQEMMKIASSYLHGEKVSSIYGFRYFFGYFNT